MDRIHHFPGIPGLSDMIDYNYVPSRLQRRKPVGKHRAFVDPLHLEALGCPVDVMKGLIGEDHVDTIGRQNHGTIASSDWPDIAMLISSRFPDFRVVECSRIERIDSAPWAYNFC